MPVMNSVFEFAFFPMAFICIGFGFWLGLKIAMNDERRVIYWRRRAKAAEGQLRSVMGGK